MEDARHFIDNQWVAASNSETIPVVDPSDGQIFAQIALGTPADIDRAVSAARAAYDGAWGAMSAAERGRILARLSMLISSRHEESPRSKRATPASRSSRRAPTPPASRTISSSTRAPPTSCTAKRCPINPASPC